MSLCARDIMTRRIVTISPENTVGDAIDLLIARGISGLPVVDAEQNMLGIITEYAVLAAAYEGGIANEPVSDHMTKHVISVGEGDTLQQVANHFIVHKVRRVPVVTDGRLVGQISRRDVLRGIKASCLSYEATPAQ